MMLPPVPNGPPPPFGVAGFARLYEGEGSIGTTARHGPRSARRSLHMRLQMTDEDVIRAVHHEFGGNVCPVTRKDRPANKQAYQWDINGWRAAVLAWQMLPFLFSRRREQVAGALSFWLENRTATETPVAKFLAEIGCKDRG